VTELATATQKLLHFCLKVDDPKSEVAGFSAACQLLIRTLIVIPSNGR